MAIIRRPPGLAVGHQRRQVGFDRIIVERLERFGIIEIIAQRITRQAVLLEDFERKLIGPPVAIGAAQQGAPRGGFLHRTAQRVRGFGIHGDIS